MWKLHGLPLLVLLDHGPQFVLQFMHELYHLLNIKVAASTAYHPQTDGQMEHINQELEQYLCIFVNERQDDWDNWLPMAKFIYNNHFASVFAGRCAGESKSLSPTLLVVLPAEANYHGHSTLVRMQRQCPHSPDVTTNA